ncbi:MAG: hypothetical protein VSS75_022060 [Candidatus Parabeggiatoa sp.]|nr:hypothetical protein [Candidatus Parabeggiatoa sp.]
MIEFHNFSIIQEAQKIQMAHVEKDKQLQLANQTKVLKKNNGSFFG